MISIRSCPRHLYMYCTILEKSIVTRHISPAAMQQQVTNSSWRRNVNSAIQVQHPVYQHFDSVLSAAPIIGNKPFPGLMRSQRFDHRFPHFTGSKEQHFNSTNPSQVIFKTSRLLKRIWEYREHSFFGSTLIPDWFPSASSWPVYAAIQTYKIRSRPLKRQ